MLRILMAGLALLAASACTVGLPSEVEAAPFADRMAKAPFADGVYCALERDEARAPLVRTSQADGENNCATFSWQAARREFTARDTQDEEPKMTFTPADLGGGLFLLQMPVDEADLGETPYAFWLMTGAAHGDAVAFLPLPFDERVAAMAARHPGVRLATHQVATPLLSVPVPEGSDENVAPEPQTRAVTYIAGGSAVDVRRFVRDLTVELFAGLADEAAAEGAPLSQAIPMLVRDTAGGADHPPTQAQQRDIEAVAETLGRILQQR